MPKMKFVAAILLSAFAAVANANSGRAVDGILNKLQHKDSWVIFAVSKGHHEVGVFDPETLSQSAITEDLDLRLANTDECQYSSENGTPAWDALIKLETEHAFEEPRGIRYLTKLFDANTTSLIIGRGWDGASGDLDTCGQFEYRVYFNNGRSLILNYDLRM